MLRLYGFNWHVFILYERFLVWVVLLVVHRVTSVTTLAITSPPKPPKLGCVEFVDFCCCFLIVCGLPCFSQVSSNVWHGNIGISWSINAHSDHLNLSRQSEFCHESWGDFLFSRWATKGRWQDIGVLLCKQFRTICGHWRDVAFLSWSVRMWLGSLKESVPRGAGDSGPTNKQGRLIVSIQW